MKLKTWKKIARVFPNTIADECICEKESFITIDRKGSLLEYRTDNPYTNNSNKSCGNNILKNMVKG
jgi:hypothetical protein